MKIFQKLSIQFLLSLFCVLFCLTPIKAQETPNPTKTPDTSTTYVFDQTGTLSSDEIHTLNSKCDAISNKIQVGIYLEFIDSMMDESDIEVLNEKIYQEEHRGLTNASSGLQLLVSKSERRYDILAYGKGNEIFTDYGKDQAAEKLIEQLRDDNYYFGFLSYLDQVDYEVDYYLQSLNQQDETHQEGPIAFDVGNDPKNHKDPKEDIPLYFLGSFLLSFGITMFLKGRMNTTKKATNANYYINQDGLQLTSAQDYYIMTTTTRTYSPINKDNNSSGGGTSINSGGFSHSSGSF